MTNQPDLKFGPAGATEGFTPAGIAAFSDLRPAAVVRELIQNSLDAALVEAEEDCARVKFCRRRIPASEVPGIDSYRTAFARAVDTQIEFGGGRMPTQAESVVERIQAALNDPYPYVLSVTDNGVGLDDRKMSALLSDGVSSKSANAAGTFGNGHSVPVPASDLRYLLYGGLVAEGRKIGAGQAIVASHRVPGELLPCSSRGFYIQDFRFEGGTTYEYASGSQVPHLIDQEIEWIRQTHGHGSAVIIPFFNNFHDDRDLKTMVARAAACNFFQAIHEQRLVVEVEDQIDDDDDETAGTVSWTLDRDTLGGVLREYRDERRISRGAFLTGEKANDAFETLVEGDLISVSTAIGSVSLRLQRDVGNRQVCLVRNGMWITDSLNSLSRAKFADRQPFRALLLLEPHNRNKLYELIQRSEAPLHDKLSIKQLADEDRRRLRAALGSVRDCILSHVPEVKSDSYTLSGLLDVQFDGVEAGSGGSGQRSFWGTPSARRTGVPSTKGDGGEVIPPGNPPRPGTTDRPPRKGDGKIVHPSLFQVASAPAGPGRQRVHIKADSACADAHLYIFVDENVDATCDRRRFGKPVLVRISGVTIDGEAKPDAVVGGGTAVRLGDLSEGGVVDVEASYEVPTGDLLVLPGQPPTLRVEVVQVRDRADPSASAASVGTSEG